MRNTALAITAAAVLCPAAPTLASQVHTATLDQMVSLNRRALGELRAGKAEAARDTLRDAVVLGKQAGLGTHQMMARTYLHLGAVYLEGLGDRPRAIQHLALALKLRPQIQVTREIDGPSLASALAEAKREADLPPAEIAVRAQPGDADDEAPRTDGRQGRWWVGLGLGSGVGVHGRRDVEAHRTFEVSGGVSPAALLHVAPEVGWWLSDTIGVSLQSRHQFLPATNDPDDTTARPPRTAHAVLARALWRVGALAGADLFATGAVGGGSAFRLYVPPKASAGLGGSDTLSAGPVVVGPGVGLAYRAGRLSLGGEARALAGVWRFAVLGDVTLGASYVF